MINILISTNENYISKAKTMLYSLHLHTKGNITVYFLNHDVPDYSLKDFKKFLKKRCNMSLQTINMGKTVFDKLPLGSGGTSYISIETYYRIFAQFVLPEDVDRVIWIDADIICMNDISDFYYQDFDNNTMVVCQDRMCNKYWVTDAKIKLGLDESHTYFNAGLLLINIDLLRNMASINELADVCLSISDKLTYLDQDILNYLYTGKVKYADWKKYNYQLFNDDTFKENSEKDIVFLHYTGPHKPWKDLNIKKTTMPYWRTLYLSGERKEFLRNFSKFYYLKFKDKIHFVKKDISKLTKQFFGG